MQVKNIIKYFNLVKHEAFFLSKFYCSNEVRFLICARVISVLSILLFSIIMGSAALIINYTLKLMYQTFNIINIKLWYFVYFPIILLLLLPLVFNFSKNSYNYSSILVGIPNAIFPKEYEISDEKTKIGKLKALIKILFKECFYIIFIFAFSLLFNLCLVTSSSIFGNHEWVIVNLKPTDSFIRMFYKTLPIPIALFIFTAFFLLPEDDNHQKYFKYIMKFFIWLTAIIVSIIYMINRLDPANQNFTIDMLYYSIALLISFDRLYNTFCSLKMIYKNSN